LFLYWKGVFERLFFDEGFDVLNVGL